MPIELTEEMTTAVNSALAERVPCVLATASKDGTPDLAIRGSMMIYDNDHLAYWERSRNESLANLEENPKVAIFFRNPAARLNWRFYGTAQLFKDGDMRQKIMDKVVEPELAQDPERKGIGVLIKVDRVRAGNNVIQER